jgi:hypothetical protein
MLLASTSLRRLQNAHALALRNLLLVPPGRATYYFRDFEAVAPSSKLERSQRTLAATPKSKPS